ncbi:hypothetical protein MKX01_017299 [Papaver californicum]|nr:hypothetical protein MKX01_017299 [Papaver californicum]
MVDQETSFCPSIVYRQLRPSDIGVLERIHCDLFPIRYESEFFHNAASGRDIVSWGAIGDMLRYDPTRTDQTLVYILTLGVVESYRNRGIVRTKIIGVLLHPGQHYDSLLFVYYVNGSQSPSSPLEIVATVAAYVRSFFKLMVTRLWKSEEKVSRWSKCKESNLLTAQNKRNITSRSDGCLCV